MTEARFVELYNGIWAALEKALAAPARTFSAIERRNNLYRVVSGHLSYARGQYPSSPLCGYLERLVSQAHAVVYAYNERRSMWRFLSRTLPQLVLDNGRYILISAALFIAGMLLSFIVCAFAPEYGEAFLPENYRHISERDLQSQGTGSAGWSGAIMSNTIMINNIRVSVLAFGLGLTCGLGTAYVLLTNGLLLGALGGLYFRAGRSLFFWSLILPHGVWELAAIFIAGAAGLRLGYSLMRPGPYRRIDALVAASRGSLGLMALASIMLVVAGFVEGFFTPSPEPESVKLMFAAVSAIPLCLYCTLPLRYRVKADTALQE